jgi:outer membrane protein, heavy metal efflux system
MPMVRYQLSQMVFWPGNLGLMREAVLRRADGANAGWKGRRLELELEANRAYLMLVRNARLREVNQASRGLLTTIVSTALARYSAGTGGHHEVSRAEVELNAVEVEKIELDGDRMAIVAMMNALRNYTPDRRIADPGDPADRVNIPPVPELLPLAVARRPELEGMRAMQHEEESMAALARRERYPDFMTSVWYNQMLGGPDTVVDAARRFLTAQRSLEFVNGVAAPRAQQSFISSLAGYSTGTVDIVGVLDAWRAFLAVERSRAELIVARATALAELERAAGGGLRGSRA